MDLLKPPFTNINRKGRKAKTGVKSSNGRLTIYRKVFEKKQEKEKKKEKAVEEVEKKEQQVKYVKARYLTLSQQKRKIALIIGNIDAT
jgi:hypothetical protein